MDPDVRALAATRQYLAHPVDQKWPVAALLLLADPRWQAVQQLHRAVQGHPAELN